MVFVVGKVTTAKRIELERDGYKVYNLPASIARHFVAPMTVGRGESVVAAAIDGDIKHAIEICEKEA